MAKKENTSQQNSRQLKFLQLETSGKREKENSS
jgi:hypothetical protein